ncbi:MAG TPA: AAA family ATPase [Solirubrobacteraceae bacterium]|nr:AAA family ATPase [Solirubrobacteraceae bacterium]
MHKPVIDTPAGSLELLERSTQLEVLGRSLSAVASGRRGQLVLLRGEAGVGKTAVVRRFCDAQGPPTRILWGACEALFTPRDLGPFVDIAQTDGGELGELVRRGGLPHEVLSALAQDVERALPTVLVLEDLHWADEATLDVLRLLGRRLDRFCALVVATYRDDELEDGHPLRIVLGELARAQGVQRVDLSRLSPEAVASLAEPYGVDAQELYRTTGGNAFFVSEVLAAPSHEVPSTVRDAVLARAARMSDDAMAVLEALAVAPPAAQIGVLEAIAGGDLRGLEECIGAGMVVPAQAGVAFRHELGRLVIEESMSPNRRVALHARALRALEGSSDFARLAHHAEAAGDHAAVVRFASEAAQRASAVGAHRESAAQYARTLRFADALVPAAQADLLERRAYECMVSDKIDEAIEALHSALAIRREAGDARGEAEGLYLLSNVLWCPGRVDEATEAARRAVDVLEGMQPSRELAMAYSRFAQLCTDAEDLDDALTWGARAVGLAEELGEVDVRIDSLISAAIARWLSGDDTGREELERCLVLASDAGLDDRVGRIEVNLVWVTRRRREYAQAYSYLEPALRSASELGMELWRGYLLAYRAQMELDLGRWQDAVDSAALVLRDPRRSRIPQLTALSVVGRVRARRGDPDVASPLDEALALAARSEELQASEPVAVARAEVAWLQGDRRGVEQATDTALALARTRRSPWVVAELAAWRRRAGIVDTLSAGETAGPHALEVAGKWPQAAARWQQLGCPYEAALALAETDDRGAQRTALGALQELGAKPAEAIVARRLRDRGVRDLPRGPRARTRSNPAGLTARELEVLALLTEGLRNADIAARLVVSAKTVDHHVSAILRKLGVRTRSEAVAAAWRLDLGVSERGAVSPGS